MANWFDKKWRSWDPTSVDGLGDWEADFQAERTPELPRRPTRGRPRKSLPLSTRLADVRKELEELDRSLLDLSEMQ